MTDVSTPAAAARHRARFHPLTVAAVERLTDDAVAVTFAVPDELVEEFAFEPGQHLTLRASIGGEDVRSPTRSASHGGAERGGRRLRVAAARVPDGRMSTWLNDVVAPGDVVEVMTPQARSPARPGPTAPANHVAIAAGSGITPVLSLLTTALEEETGSRAHAALRQPAHQLGDVPRGARGPQEPLPRPLPPRQRALARGPGRRALPRPARPGAARGDLREPAARRLGRRVVPSAARSASSPGPRSCSPSAASTPATSTTRSSTSTTARRPKRGRRRRHRAPPRRRSPSTSTAARR